MGQIAKNLKYSMRESFPVARWCLCAVVIAFTAVVSIYKYIDLSDMTATGFSSLETLFLIMTDSTNIIFIFLPTFLFIICGLTVDNNFGAVDIVKMGSRKKWLSGKFILLVINALVFFIIVTLLCFIIANRIFPFSNAWSTGFISFRVMLGNSAMDFKYPPIPTLLLSVLSSFMMYLLCGVISMSVSLITDREESALLVSLLFGIGLNLLNYNISSNNALSHIWRSVIILLFVGIIYFVCNKIACVKDFHLRKKTSLY